MSNYIVTSAIRWFNVEGGECIVWGARKDLSNAHHLIRDFLMEFNPLHGSMLFKKAEQGFLTNGYKFVGREQALVIAVFAEQIIHKHPDYEILYSEDLRPCRAANHNWCHIHREDGEQC